MLEENSNHEEEADIDEEVEQLFNEDGTPKPADGDGSDNDEGTVLARINEATGKNYKSIADFQKSQKELEKALAEKGREKKGNQAPTSTTSRIVTDLFFDKHPEAKEYWEEVQKEAKVLNKDPFDLYLSSNLLQKEAQAKYSKKEEKNDAYDRMGRPSNQVETDKKTEVNKFNNNFPSGFAIRNK
jgi:UTP-glucose-1-phosphate uridylyltransferase